MAEHIDYTLLTWDRTDTVSRTLVRLIAQSTNDGIWDWNLETGEVYYSPRWLELVGYRPNELPGHIDTFTNLLHPDDRDNAQRTITEYVEGASDEYRNEFRLQHKDGSWRWIFTHGIKRRDATGRATHLVGTHTDITDRVTAAKRLELTVEERTTALRAARDKAEVLLTEVNHRVANSLSMVAALVRLQSSGLKDPAAKLALHELQGRIDAISAVHRSLYSSGDARLVDLRQYLSGLLSNIEKSMRSDGHGASLRYEIDALKLKPDLVVKPGVIVTEWVTNAFKYAYPDRVGEVRVHLKQLPAGRAELVVEDDGVGRGPESTSKGSEFGTQIVTAMARTVGAEVKYVARYPGTCACLAFPFLVEAE